jgi:hypothetical protein
MPAFRQPTSHDQRRQWWRRQFARQQSANLSVTEFCRQLGVTLSAFYYWKKRVDEALDIVPGHVPEEYPSRRLSSIGAGRSSFVPVSILDSDAGAQLEIELNNACVIRIKGVVDPSLLQAAIEATGRLDGSFEGAN